MKVSRFLLFGLLVGLLLGPSGGLLTAQEEAMSECTVTVQPGESIQAAIDAAAEGLVICLTKGTWKENVKIEKSLTLRGDAERSEDVRIVGVKGGHPVIRIESEKEIKVSLVKPWRMRVGQTAP